MSTKVLDLAKQELSKSDLEKSLGALTDSVEDNKMQWMNEIHGAKKDLTQAKKSLAAAQKNVHVKATEFLQVERQVALAEANLEALNVAFEARF